MTFDTARYKELQTALRGLVTSNKAIADAVEFKDGALTITSEHRTAFDANMAQIREIKSLLVSMDEMKALAEWGAEPVASSVAAAVAADGAFPVRSVKTLGEAFIASDEFKLLQGGKNGATMRSPFQLKVADLAGFNTKDVYSALPTGTPGSFGTVQRDSIVTLPKRRNRIRDLFPVQTTSAAVIEYFRVGGYTNNASVVPERVSNAFGLKPQTALTFDAEQAPVRTIAHWEAAHRNVLADEPQLRGIIDNELLYGLRLHEDFQILSGTGTGDDLAGILTNGNIQTYAWSTGETLPVPDNKADAIRRAMTLAFLAYYEPTGVVLHPNDWEDVELTKNDQGSYLMAVSIQQGAEARIWRVPVIDTPAISEGTALVGAFGTGAQLYDREEASIRISEQHADFFVRNAIVVLAEERLALAVKRPEAFVAVDFDAPPA